MASNRQSEVLLVEDTRILARSYIQFLRNEPVAVTHVETGKAALDRLEESTPHAILLDIELPDMNGLDILKGLGGTQLPCPVIVITAHGSINVAVEAMRLGAFDFIVKPFNADRLIVTLRNALERQQLSNLVETYREKIDRSGFCGLIGSSLAMQGVYRTIETAAVSKATIFVRGESGTGKELCARAVHDLSPRARKPFIALNCAAIPHDLMESEIFGHVRGAFSGAIADREGAARAADGGTLFLDEVCEMDLDLQSKLLRFIQTETFSRVGARRDEQVDIRFVCATNRDPFAEVRAGRFREDLYYRLHVVPVELPPLRARDEDAIELAEHFLRVYAAEEGKDFAGLSAAAKAVFLSYDWPGNVRELQNVMRQIVVLSEGGEVTLEMLPPPLPGRAAAAWTPRAPARAGAEGEAVAATAPDALPAIDPQDIKALSAHIRPLAAIEREAIEHALKLCDGKVRIAAALLGVSHATLYRKVNAWRDGEE
jgi:DNA-binding NtrC family response regulator